MFIVSCVLYLSVLLHQRLHKSRQSQAIECSNECLLVLVGYLLLLVQMAVADRYRKAGNWIAYYFISAVLVLLGSNMMVLVVKVGKKAVKRGRRWKARKAW